MLYEEYKERVREKGIRELCEAGESGELRVFYELCEFYELGESGELPEFGELWNLVITRISQIGRIM